jgi:hypothetical protein
MKFSIHKIADEDFALNFKHLTAAETAEMLSQFRRLQRMRDGTITSPKKMTEYLTTVANGFEYSNNEL